MKKPAEKPETRQPSPSRDSGRCATLALPLSDPSMAMCGCMFACIFAPVLHLYLCLCVSCVSTIYAEKRLKLTAFNMHNIHTHKRLRSSHYPCGDQGCIPPVKRCNFKTERFAPHFVSRIRPRWTTWTGGGGGGNRL